jgi:nicotinamide-nucleotide amidase
MKAEIITIGDELLIGQTVDTNSAWIGSELSKAGFDVTRRTSVHDKHKDIVTALSQISAKTDVVLITGGLGPTSDDITKPALCEFFNTRLITNSEVLSRIENMLNRRGFAMNDNNHRQADVPEACRILENTIGTAPGMWFEKGGTIFISLPGVPPEMKYIMTEHVLPELNKRFKSQIIIHRNIMTFGSYEAKLSEILSDFEASLPQNIKLAYLPSMGVIKLRFTGTGSDRTVLIELIDKQIVKLKKIIPDLIFATEEESLEKVTGRLLKENNLTLCTAESCTGGRIAQMITSIPGSSNYFKGSVIAYDNTIKIKLLGVSEEIIEKNGAVSEQVVRNMAENARNLLDTDFSVATSGIAGPDGGTDAKPVGTVWIAVASEKETIAERFVFGNDRKTNIERFSLTALNLLRKQIIKKNGTEEYR